MRLFLGELVQQLIVITGIRVLQRGKAELVECPSAVEWWITAEVLPYHPQFERLQLGDFLGNRAGSAVG
jgi:hypothetical protein